MPIYEYQCQSCHKVFEFMQRMAEDPKTECEECQGALERIISQSAFHLKGGGWYKDLYASTKKEGDSKGSENSSSESKSSDGAPATSSNSGASAEAPAKSSSDTSSGSANAAASSAPAPAKAKAKDA